MQTEARDHTGSFDCLRLLAAFAVLFCHSYALKADYPHEPIWRLTDGVLTFGTLAVYVFFAISGYLVTQSWLRDASVKRFLQRRLLRIIPALAVVLLASVFVVGATLTTLPLADYFTSAETWTYLSKVFLYPSQHALPGVFTNNPEPDIVNGSLWTLRAEFTLYLIIAALGVTGRLKNRVSCVLLTVACLCVMIVTLQPGMATMPGQHHLYVMSANGVPFFIGSTLAIGKINWKLAVGKAVFFSVLAIAFFNTLAFTPLLLCALSLITILLARNVRCDLSRYGDISYGVYLWAFIAQQSLIVLMPDISIQKLFASSAAITLILGVLSWHLVEKQFLKFKPHRAA